MNESAHPGMRRLLPALLMLSASAALAAGAYVFREQLAQLAGLGYVGVFLISLLGSATLFLPAPSYLFVITLGGVLNPLAVGMVAGLGAALGELTGYLAGRAGTEVLGNDSRIRQVSRWVRRYGVLSIFALAAIPNPLFDVGGIAAGAIQMPVWQFVLAAWLGKSVRMLLLAASGALLLGS